MERYTIGSLLLKGKQSLADNAIPQYGLDAELLLAHVLQVGREQLIGYPERSVSHEDSHCYQAYIARRNQREPVSKIVGKKEFWDSEFNVTRDTLDPRPDSETLIEATFEYYHEYSDPQTILDLGTGTGCLLLTLLKLFPDATGVGIDISEKALEVAKKNSRNLMLANRVQFLLQCMGAKHDKCYDLVISNPPYIKHNDLMECDVEVKGYDPYIALVGGEDGLEYYRVIASKLWNLLTNHGLAILEVGYGQAEDVQSLCESHKLHVFDTKKDLAGVVRCLMLRKIL